MRKLRRSVWSIYQSRLEDVRKSRQHNQGSHEDLRDTYAIVGFGLEAPIEAKAEGGASKGEEGKGREYLINLHEVFYIEA
ncbi:hypothetical protein RC74_18555 [Falsihalocynthiibacter arcticus]|uniref:Uncharacterized protein n=2 Tax=Falsihalocynthiibacter arcticus TaxID=1579316 RepID=A0A126V5K2_9RHOB|nr:hypothetical protein RC74_18555 [Falsihalocynthiibacter arcticus]